MGSYSSQIVDGTFRKEHIVIDGASTDGTLGIIRRLADDSTTVLSEPDCGLYDALNKGIRIASGDVVGVLHSDDCFYSNRVLLQVVDYFSDHPDVDIVYADIVYVKNMDSSTVARYHSGKHFRRWMLGFGMMPPHTSMFMRRRVFDLIGYYRTDYKIAADFELLSRCYQHPQIKLGYLNMISTKMSFGGVSNAGVRAKMLLNREIWRACRDNNISTSLLLIYLKYFVKIFEFVVKKL